MWNVTKLDKTELRKAACRFIKNYNVDVFKDLESKVDNQKRIYKANFKADLSPMELLNSISSQNLKTIFPNICIALRIFTTIPVTVASAKRSFSVLSRVKNYNRSCSLQMRVLGLATLCIELALARKLDFGVLKSTFASTEARM